MQRKIIKACNLTKQDIVLEIGAGLGNFSAQIAPCVKKLYALEIDERLYPYLEQSLIKQDNCQVVKCDILKFNLSKFLKDNLIKQKIKVIGNIPYYISSPIIEKLINYRDDISVAFMTVQKEFARRVVAGPGSKEYGSFSCFVQYYTLAKILFEIKPGCFNPSPKVDSCFLSLEFRDQPAVKTEDEEFLFKLIRTAFGQRRKTLRNSLDGVIGQVELEKFLDEAGIDKNIRPEALALEQFAQLAKKIQKIS